MLIAVVLVFVLVPTLALADNYTGHITLTDNNEPTVDLFTVTNIPLQPTTACTVNLTVSDADGFSDISQVFLVFWYTTTAGDPTVLPDTIGNIKSSNLDSQTLHWVEVWDGIGSFSTDTTNTTWTASSPAGMPTGGEVNSFAFANFTVTPGKEAQEVETPTDTDKWVIGVLVVDSTGNETFQLADGTAGTYIGMDWYGEMYADPAAGPYWTGATAGMAYADLAAQVFDPSYPLDVTANGAYDLNISAETAWSNSDPNTISYDTLVDAADEFSLAVDTSPTYSAVTAQELPNDPGVTGFTDPVAITPNTWGVGTDYAGISITNIYLYLQTNAVMTVSAQEYTGFITVTISNDVP
ncbi:MAG: hypothetical protein AB1Z23_08795 [Eubacteriales bacterium]